MDGAHVFRLTANPLRWPLWTRVVIGVLAGAALGVAFGNRPYLFGLKNADMEPLGLAVISLLKALAGPLIFFAVADSIVRTYIPARQVGRLFFICAVNLAVAMAIGLAIMNFFHPGETWRGRMKELAEEVVATEAQSPGSKGAGAPRVENPSAPRRDISLSPLKNIPRYLPTSLVEPFLKNEVIPIVLLGILTGAALRFVRRRDVAVDRGAVATLEQLLHAGYFLLMQMLLWVVELVPLAVLCVVAKVVGVSGLGIFQSLWVFLVVVVAGLAIHGLLYYPAAAWFWGGKPPWVYLGKGADAVLTAFSMNSSLGTVPITLRCLTEKMGVSEQSARLSACIGTNLNNDGIILYDAMAALFLAQALGYHLSFSAQMGIVAASIMAGVGIGGIPEAGLIVLPLVLSSVGLPEETIVLAIPLIFSIDWIIARCRSAVNTLSDMLVAIVLDRGVPRS
ncbi:MAG: dicarboxylate/amino acid:cation symporter [Planctomycetia bacterium]|nr:dicarboxylate/amino acid:cation symporter [Planctomycetia bacterium]